jgi:hypothetical protein
MAMKAKRFLGWVDNLNLRTGMAGDKPRIEYRERREQPPPNRPQRKWGNRTAVDKPIGRR